MIAPWQHSKKRKAIATSKFYFFDTGVTHSLTQTKTLEQNSDLYGRGFEQWIAMELRCYIDYRRLNEPLCFWQNRQQYEVDFIIDNHTAIETKATKKITSRDLRGLIALHEEKKLKNYYLVSQDTIETKNNDIHCLHWKTFMELLWSDKLF